MKYFLDCGTHFGQGLKEISSLKAITNDWTIKTFEANPNTYKKFMNTEFLGLKMKYPLLESINSAVHTRNGKIDLNIEIPPGEGETGQGTSIIEKNKWVPQNGTLKFKDELVSVDCIDFSELIESLDDAEYVLVKFDIEGAEYDILEKLIQSNAIKKIDEIFIEFHHDFFTNRIVMKFREDEIVNKLVELGIKLTLWK